MLTFDGDLLKIMIEIINYACRIIPQNNIYYFEK